MTKRSDTLFIVPSFTYGGIEVYLLNLINTKISHGETPLLLILGQKYSEELLSTLSDKCQVVFVPELVKYGSYYERFCRFLSKVHYMLAPLFLLDSNRVRSRFSSIGNIHAVDSD